MNSNLCLPDKSEIARQILAYLADHPDAEDTLDGIVQWWLLERKIKYQQELVRETLNELISRKLLIIDRDKHPQPLYRLNRTPI